jgi:hypothetical protein
MEFYQPLNHTKNEVRMLTIMDPPESNTSGFVHCTLEHASLDDSDTAIKFISSIARFTLVEEGTFDPWDSNISEASALEEELSALPWKALLSFFSRSYWQKLWII